MQQHINFYNINLYIYTFRIYFIANFVQNVINFNLNYRGKLILKNQ